MTRAQQGAEQLLSAAGLTADHMERVANSIRRGRAEARRRRSAGGVSGRRRLQPTPAAPAASPAADAPPAADAGSCRRAEAARAGD